MRLQQIICGQHHTQRTLAFVYTTLDCFGAQQCKLGQRVYVDNEQTLHKKNERKERSCFCVFIVNSFTFVLTLCRMLEQASQMHSDAAQI